jgi:hypothetical protein
MIQVDESKLREVLDAIKAVEGIALVHGLHQLSIASDTLRSMLEQKPSEPTIKDDLMVQRISKSYNMVCHGMLYLKEGELTNCLLALQDSAWELEPVIEHFSTPKEPS